MDQYLVMMREAAVIAEICFAENDAVGVVDALMTMDAIEFVQEDESAL